MHVNNLRPPHEIFIHSFFIFVSRPVHFLFDTNFRSFFSNQANVFTKRRLVLFLPLNKEDGESRCSELHPVIFIVLFLFFGRGDETKGPGLPQNLYFSCIAMVTHLPALRGSRRTQRSHIKLNSKDGKCEGMSNMFPLLESLERCEKKGAWIHSVLILHNYCSFLSWGGYIFLSAV